MNNWKHKIYCLFFGHDYDMVGKENYNALSPQVRMRCVRCGRLKTERVKR